MNTLGETLLVAGAFGGGVAGMWAQAQPYRRREEAQQRQETARLSEFTMQQAERVQQVADAAIEKARQEARDMRARLAQAEHERDKARAKQQRAARLVRQLRVPLDLQEAHVLEDRVNTEPTGDRDASSTNTQELALVVFENEFDTLYARWAREEEEAVAAAAGGRLRG